MIQPSIVKEEQGVLDSLFVIDSHYHAGPGEGMAHIVRQLCDARLAQTKPADPDLVLQQDLEQIWRCNLRVPLDVESAVVYDWIAETTKHQPGAQAKCAWNGEWTYRQLDELSTCLAHQMGQGVKPRGIVPLCIEKSKWIPIAMVAAMKAGDASILLIMRNRSRGSSALCGKYNYYNNLSSQRKLRP